MTDLERFFRQLVRNLAATDPARLRRPLPLPEVRESIVPYRANRRALQLESSEDYELVLMRLCAGEGGFARTEPDDARAAFAAEIRSSNPDLTVIHQYENAIVSLEPQPLAEALGPEPDLAFAPPASSFAPPTEEPADLPVSEFPSLDLPSLEPYETVPEPEPAAGESRCNRCGGSLPVGRAVNFCPHCGGTQVPTRCPECKADLEPGWRHCVTCGLALDQQ
jgi:double zinc ribbon protein